jgi:tetratricopeptide (TPR) repeat protein
MLQKAIEVRPNEPAPYYQLSLAYRRSGQEQLARAELEKFQELRKASEGAKYLRTGLVAYVREGMKLSESERQARELQYLERAVAIKAGDAGIMERLVNAYLDAGKKAQAEESIRQWLARDATGQAALKVGMALARHGDYEGAIPYFSQAAEDKELSYPAQMSLADAQFHLGRYEAALALLSQLTPPADNVDYYSLRASILDKLQRYEEALATYQQAIRVQPLKESPYIELGLFFVEHQAFDAAIEDFRAAQKVLPRSLKLALAEAIVLNLAGHREDSFQKLRGIEKRWPEQDWPYILAGISAYTAYHYEDSRREFEKAAALESSNPLTYYYLALLDTASPQDDSSEALRWAEMAVKNDPSFAQARLLLGKIYNRQGKTNEARQNLEEAVRLEPNLADAHYLLSRIYAQLGETASAEAQRHESERWHRDVHQVSPEKENILRLLIQVEPTHK